VCDIYLLCYTLLQLNDDATSPEIGVIQLIYCFVVINSLWSALI